MERNMMAEGRELDELRARVEQLQTRASMTAGALVVALAVSGRLLSVLARQTPDPDGTIATELETLRPSLEALAALAPDPELAAAGSAVAIEKIAGRARRQLGREIGMAG
jgi:hypothetical protein